MTIRNRMIASWSALESTLRWTCAGMIAKKNAAARPTRLPNVSLPRKYTGTTVRAPQNAVDQTRKNPTESSIESNSPSISTAGMATDMLKNGGLGLTRLSG